MDSWLLFQHRPLHMGNGGTQEGRWGVPIGHGASPILAPIYRGEERGKLRGDLRRPHRPYTVKKSPIAWSERPYREPTLVGGDKNPQVVERTLVKELGKITP
jgi:hypothetical protein